MAKRSTENQETIRSSTDQFVANVRKYLSKYEPNEVINTDQSGIELELRSTQTLSYKGEKLLLHLSAQQMPLPTVTQCNQP